MSNEKNKKEASRKKSLGELGELFAIKALVDNRYDNIVNLNDKKMERNLLSALKQETNTRKITN